MPNTKLQAKPLYINYQTQIKLRVFRFLKPPRKRFGVKLLRDRVMVALPWHILKMAALDIGSAIRNEWHSSESVLNGAESDVTAESQSVWIRYNLSNRT